jgi:hypothetical protein
LCGHPLVGGWLAQFSSHLAYRRPPNPSPSPSSLPCTSHNPSVHLDPAFFVCPDLAFAIALVCCLGFRSRGNPSIAPPYPPLRLHKPSPPPPPGLGMACAAFPQVGDGLRSHLWGCSPFSLPVFIAPHLSPSPPAHRMLPCTSHSPSVHLDPAFAVLSDLAFTIALVCRLGFRSKGNPPIAPLRPPLWLHKPSPPRGWPRYRPRPNGWLAQTPLG